MGNNFTFQEAHFNRIFPFYILLNADLQIVSNGKTLDKLFPNLSGKKFIEYFKIKRPELNKIDFQSIQSLANGLVVLECYYGNQITLRGQIDFLEDSNKLLFLGSPWFDSIEEVTKNNLSLHDFAYHDSMTDMLHLMKTQEIINDDLKNLLDIVQKQKDKLKDANKKIHEIALFPTQNPDPLLRINFEGDLIQNNPSAAKLDFVTYENKEYRVDDFFKLIATKIDMNQPRWIFEANSNDVDYSFVCITMKDQGYVNIYGRDITQQKKDQEELERLSLIIQQTQNAVIITDALGRVEWVNNAFERVSGYTLDEVKLKTPGSVLQGPDTNPDTISYMKEQISKSEPFVCEIYNYKKSGEGYWLRINGQPIFDKAGNVIQFFAIEEDITYEKETQENIKIAAGRMSSLITNLHAGILLENENRSIALINQRFCEIFNIPASPSELVGIDCSNAAEQSKYLFSDPDFFVSNIVEILENRELVVGQQLQMADGRFLERDFIPIWNEGKYDGHLWVYTDITEKVTIDKKLDEQRKFYEKILDNIPADIAVFDNEHHYLYVNPMGIKDDELRKWMVGKKDEDYFRYRNKPVSLAVGRRQLFNGVLELKKLKSWEEELKQPDGSSRYVMRNMYPVLNTSNEVEYVIGYGIDFTNIKTIQQQIEESEKRYRDVIENSLAVITTHDLDGRFLTVNPMAGKIYGYSDEEMIGHSLKNFIPEQDQQLFEQNYLSKIFRDKQASGIFRVLRKDGQIVYSLYNNFLKEEQGKVPYVIGFAVDVTDRIKAEKELKVAKKITEELAETKQNFLTNMSHEIRTPMNAIIGMSRQLYKTKLNEQQNQYLESITAASENLLIIINDILDLSKLEAGKLSLEKIGFEPKLVIQRVMQVMLHKAEEKGIALINTYFDKRLSPVLLGDPYRINQILLNLVSNSIKFTEKGGVDISCNMIEDSATEQLIEITVTDSGVGMDAFFVKNLFQKFSQEDETIARRYGGTGLGMSITKQLVDLMKGEITVESKKNHGTKISIKFILEKGKESDLVNKNSMPINAENLIGKKVLVVDDNEMNRLLAATIIKEYGVLITECSNGEEALDLLSKYSFDLVLMDIQMPVMNGLEATIVIREKLKSTIPIIALTANAIKGENEKCFAVGMNDYVAKPFDEDQIISVISKWIINTQIGSPINSLSDQNNPINKDMVEPLYNLNQLEQIAKGNKEFVKKMVALFINQAPSSMKEIEDAYHSKDYEKIMKIAHRLKPSIDNMGIVSIKNDIRELEKNIDNYVASDTLELYIKKIGQVIDSVVVELKSL